MTTDFKRNLSDRTRINEYSPPPPSPPPTSTPPPPPPPSPPPPPTSTLPLPQLTLQLWPCPYGMSQLKNYEVRG